MLLSLFVGVVTASLVIADSRVSFTEPGLARVVRCTQVLLWEGEAKETYLRGGDLGFCAAKVGVEGKREVS